MHDSVLQTLTLIQKDPGGRADARAPAGAGAARVALPDREPAADGTLADALEAAAAEIEELHGVRVDVVRTGDAPLDERAAGARARGARGDGERRQALRRRRDLRVRSRPDDDGVSLFVRDRGVGLRPGRGRRRPARHRRVDPRHGWSAWAAPRTIVSAPGEGTEVELTLAVSSAACAASCSSTTTSSSAPACAASSARRSRSSARRARVAEAVPLIRELDPDVVLLDVHLPDGGGEAVIAQVAPERPGVKFLALSVSDAAEDVIGVIRAGARGYVTKTISGDELTDAVAPRRRRRRGLLAAARRLRARRVPRAASRSAPTRSSTSSRAREREVLQLIARGYRYKEIAGAAASLGARRSSRTCRRCCASCSSRRGTS